MAMKRRNSNVWQFFEQKQSSTVPCLFKFSNVLMFVQMFVQMFVLMFVQMFVQMFIQMFDSSLNGTKNSRAQCRVCLNLAQQCHLSIFSIKADICQLRRESKIYQVRGICLHMTQKGPLCNFTLSVSFTHSVSFYTQCVILHKVCSFTHSYLFCWNRYIHLCSVIVIYAVLLQGIVFFFANYALLSVKFSRFKICEWKKNWQILGMLVMMEKDGKILSSFHLILSKLMNFLGGQKLLETFPKHHPFSRALSSQYTHHHHILCYSAMDTWLVQKVWYCVYRV